MMSDICRDWQDLNPRPLLGTGLGDRKRLRGTQGLPNGHATKVLFQAELQPVYYKSFHLRSQRVSYHFYEDGSIVSYEVSFKSEDAFVGRLVDRIKLELHRANTCPD